MYVHAAGRQIAALIAAIVLQDAAAWRVQAAGSTMPLRSRIAATRSGLEDQH